MNKYESILLLMPDGKIFPASTQAFEITQATTKELRENIGSLVIYKNGSVYTIEDIKKVSSYGESFFSKFISVFVGAYSIKIVFSEASFHFEELKKLIVEALVFDSKNEDPVFDYLKKDFELRITKILLTNSMAELFEAIEVPTPDDCLDML